MPSGGMPLWEGSPPRSLRPDADRPVIHGVRHDLEHSGRFPRDPLPAPENEYFHHMAMIPA